MSCRKNASPIYLILFISATYFLNRPCVYCSLLLAILVVSLFDFNTDWFEPSTVPQLHSNATSIISDSIAHATSNVLPEYLVSGISSVMSAATDNAVVNAIASRSSGAASTSDVESTFMEWAKGMLRKEWRIQCLDLVIRL
jgi:hypothetical protein